MLTKIILPDSFGFDEPAARLMDMHSKGPDQAWMSKRAAVFDDRVRDIKPNKGCRYLHVITTGASERYGPNANADSYNKTASEVVFPNPKKGGMTKRALDGGLQKYHKTYTKNAGVYKNHSDNKNLKASLGKIAAEAYNEKMERGELIIELPIEKWSKELDKMDKGEHLFVSQGSTVPFDICSICGHTRRTRKESCDHIDNHPLELTKEGYQVHAINDRPTFHDISFVYKPADKIAFALRNIDLSKSASRVVTGLDLADAMGYSANMPGNTPSLLAKLAKMEKEILSEISPENAALSEAFQPECGFADIDKPTLKLLQADPEAGLSTLSNMNIVVPLPVFLKIVMGDRFNEISSDVPSAQSCMPAIFSEMLNEPNGGTCPYCAPSRISMMPMLNDLLPSHSLEAPFVKRRMMMTIMRKEPGKPMRKITMVKNASDRAGVLAREYGNYLVSACKNKSEDFCRLVCLQKVADLL
jgi:hypothetical protein